MNNIDKQKERASNTEELLDHLIEIIENNDSRFSLEWSVGGETITMEIYDKLKNMVMQRRFIRLDMMRMMNQLTYKILPE